MFYWYDGNMNLWYIYEILYMNHTQMNRKLLWYLLCKYIIKIKKLKKKINFHCVFVWACQILIYLGTKF
jgi:hypothetical protein